MKKPTQQQASAASILGRIDRRLEAVGLSDNKASKEATGSRDTLRSLRRQVADGKQHGISTETLRKFAPVLKTTLEFLLNESGPEAIDDDHIDSAHVLPEDSPPMPMVPVKGYVVAGARAHYLPLANEELDWVRAPRNATGSTIALEIRGDCLGPLFDRWLVFVDDVRNPVTPDLIGETCVVGLPDDQILVKKLKRRRNGRYDLLSNMDPPIENVEVLWAAKVTDMTPRR